MFSGGRIDLYEDSISALKRKLMEKENENNFHSKKTLRKKSKGISALKKDKFKIEYIFLLITTKSSWTNDNY